MRNIALLMINAARFPAAFDNDGAWKTEGDNLVLQDGNPIWVDASGAEKVMKLDTIGRLNNEAKTWREKYETANTGLKAFEGIDAKAAREAFEKLSRIDQKKLIDSGEVETLKAQIKGEFDSQLGEKDKVITSQQSRINDMITTSAFDSSKFLKENLAVPVEMFRATFGKYFKVVDDKLEAYGVDGNRLMSKKEVGEFAKFEEAVEILTESYPYKDSILKAPEHRGSGSTGDGGQRGNGRTMSRSQVNALGAVQKAEFMALVREGKAKLTD